MSRRKTETHISSNNEDNKFNYKICCCEKNKEKRKREREERRKAKTEFIKKKISKKEISKTMPKRLLVFMGMTRGEVIPNDQAGDLFRNDPKL